MIIIIIIITIIIIIIIIIITTTTIKLALPGYRTMYIAQCIERALIGRFQSTKQSQA